MLPYHGTMLAPMRTLTQGPFWEILNHYGPPDAYVSEFVRVHENFTIDEGWIEESLLSAGSCPLWIQLMGNDESALARNVELLQRYPIEGIDLNVGCPAPKIFKKQAGGGLLKDLTLLNRLVRTLRQCCQRPLSVKIRLGFDGTDAFDQVLDILRENMVDLVTIHDRTVQDRYSGAVRYEFIQHAAEKMPMPVVANGDIDSLECIRRVLDFTHCHGIMIGRGAVRNPWIFAQWRNLISNKSVFQPCFQDIFAYLQDLYRVFNLQSTPIALGRMKQFCCYIFTGSEHRAFLKQILTCDKIVDFWFLCEKRLIQGDCTQKLWY